MTTKEGGMFLKHQKSITDSSDTVNNNSQFLNLNLNQGYKCSLEAPVVHSFSKSNNGKSFGYTVTDNLQVKGKLWNKSTTKQKDFKNPNLNIEIEDDEEEKPWMSDRDDCANKNSSTLSLHIAAYEESFEADLNEIEDLPKKSLTFKPESLSILANEDLLEFPRQMQDSKTNTPPQVQQFAASQKLFSPNQGASFSQSMKFSSAMGGGHHHEPHIPNYHIYNNIQQCPELVQHQQRLARLGLKDPWVRNYVWMFTKDMRTTQWQHFVKLASWGFKPGVVLAAGLIAAEETYSLVKHGHTSWGGGH